jgi:60 kDa SS-A/Ro ribonucleoprotein
MDYSKHVSTRATPQRERTPGRTDEVENSEGGFVHAVSDWDRLDRFLILGSEGGTFYISERDLTKDNANATIQLIKEDGLRVVNRVVEISQEGRAHKNDAALFVLAACAKLGDEQTRKLAYGVLPQVARIGTHLFQFATFVEAFGGWGRATKRAFQKWYNDKKPDSLAYQLLKYRQRDGWSHRDIMRLCHPVTTSEAHRAMFDVTTHPEKLTSDKQPELLKALPNIYTGFVYAQHLNAEPQVSLIDEYNLSWEMLPTEWLKDEAVNKKLLTKMPLMATVRQLGRLTANGTISPMSNESKMVVNRLTNDEQIAKSKIHPMHYLLASKNYAAGQGFRGGKTWNADNSIVAALDKGFMKSFKNVEPTGKAFMLGVDVSSSMRSSISGSNISCAEAAGAMAMVIARTEPVHFIHGFTSGPGGGFGYRRTSLEGFVDLGIGSNDAINDVMHKVQLRNFGGTDCAIPMLYASANDIMVDTFVVLTDSETWAGNVKPVQALRSYRQTHNPNAKLVVVGMTSSGFSIADPNDAGMLDVVGFDANVLPMIAEFSR